MEQYATTSKCFSGWGGLQDSNKFSWLEALHWKFDCTAPQIKSADHIDFFISYRRDGGATIARLLYEVLRLRGLCGFIDTESLEQGDYAESISQHIEKATNFILVVSPAALDSQWVIKEVEVAIQLEKRIIPIFTSGVTQFPVNLPPSIAVLAKENAILFDHANFEPKYKQLVEWLETPHVRLINACFKKWGETIDGVNEVYSAWKAILGPAATLEVLLPHLRKAWQGRVDESTTSLVLGSIGTWDLKQIAQDLGVEHKGDRRTLLNAINDRLRGGKTFPIEEDRGYGPEEERYYRVSDHLAVLFKSREKLEYLKEIVREIGTPPDNWRSSQPLMNAIFDCPSAVSIDHVLTKLALTGDEMRNLAEYFCGQQSGPIASIKSTFCNWVNYLDKQIGLQ